MAIWKEMV
jgi:hypothetical protein